jgi:hypothetical protein
MADQCVIGKYCHEHGFIHGAEADELRERIEQFIESVSFNWEDDYLLEVQDELREVLADVDARDSVAYLEVRDRDSDDIPGCLRLSPLPITARVGTRVVVVTRERDVFRSTTTSTPCHLDGAIMVQVDGVGQCTINEVFTFVKE